MNGSILETFDIEIVCKNDQQPPWVDRLPAATGITSYSLFRDMQMMFDEMLSNFGSGYEIVTNRRISAWCNSCHSYMGHFDMPVRTHVFDRTMMMLQEAKYETMCISKEFECPACHHTSFFMVKDPIGVLF